MKIKKLFQEMIPVILGILIALLINNLNEQRKDRNYVNTMMQTITEEVKENQKALNDIISSRNQLLDTIRFYQNEEISIGGLITKVKGLGGVSIKNTAWRSMMNSKMELLDYKKISVLTDIEDLKKLMTYQMQKLIDLVYTKGSETNDKEIELFELMIDSILYTEMELLELHEQFLSLR